MSDKPVKPDPIPVEAKPILKQIPDRPTEKSENFTRRDPPPTREDKNRDRK